MKLWPVDYVNDPWIIAREPDFVSINATVEVDFLGQCASETIAGRYWSSRGGQADFARGAMYAEGGKGFIVLPSTDERRHGVADPPAADPRCCRHDVEEHVDHVVTEHGVAELRARTIAARARALIGVADPSFRDELHREAHRLGYLTA